MATIFGNVRLDGRQFGDLMASRVADVIARTQWMLAMTTRVGNKIDDGVHALGADQWPPVARMPRLTTAFPSTLDAPPSFALPAGEAIGGRRLGGRGRVLLPQRELPFEIGDPLLVFGVLLAESLILLPQALDLLGLASRLVGTGTRTIWFPRCPASARHARYGTPTVSTCTAP